MSLLNKINEKKIVTQSILNILFGNDEDFIEDMFNTPEIYPEILYKFCLFYFTLIQAYCFAAVKSKEKYSLSEIITLDNAYNIIKDLWESRIDFDFEKKKYAVFSYLDYFSKMKNDSIFTEKSKECINMLLKPIKQFHAQGRPETNISEEYFCSLLNTFKLLSNTVINRIDGTISFTIISDNNHIEKFSIKCQPFLYFLDPNSMTETENGVLYILSGVIRSDSNGEFRFKANELKISINDDNDNQRIFMSRPTINNDIRFICKSLDLTTQWYPPDEYMGNYSFLTLLTNATKEIIKNYVESRKLSDEHFFSLINEMFDNAEIKNKLLKHVKITIDEIDKIFYELFIKFGVFRTMQFFLPDSSMHKEDVLFKDYLNILFNDKSDIENYKNKCEKSIEYEKKNLANVVHEETVLFKVMLKEITTEQRVFYILRAAGMENDTFLPNSDNILSIDNYFKMIMNPNTSYKDDIECILHFLITFYTPLVKQDSVLNKDKYISEVKQTQIKLSQTSYAISDLFDMFLKINEESKYSNLFSDLTGRSIICPELYLNHYKEQLNDKAIASWHSISKNQIFISYSHQNQDKVFAKVEELEEEEKWQIFIDKKKFDGGDDWTERAMYGINNSFCVFVFMSEDVVYKEPVKYELDYALKKGLPIIPINLEQATVSEYLSEKKYYDKKIFNSEVKEGIIQKYYNENEYDNKEKVNIIISAIKKRACFLDNIIHENNIALPFDDELNKKLKNKLIKISSTIQDNSEHYVFNEAGDLEVANFYTLLKTGEFAKHKDQEEVLKNFKTDCLKSCIYPFIVSVKETRIKRDQVTLLGYEIIHHEEGIEKEDKYILYSTKLEPSEYYCIPHKRRVSDNCSWMIEPLLIPVEYFKLRK